MHGIWKHKKTGGIYQFEQECRIEATNTPAVMYRSLETGISWVRPLYEFLDGRFEKIKISALADPD